MIPGGFVDNLPEMAAALRPLRAPCLMDPAGDTKPVVTNQRDAFHILFGRDDRTQIETMKLIIDGAELRRGLDSFVRTNTKPTWR